MINDAAPLRVAVIVGSTREGRVGDRIGCWFAEQARRRDDLDVAVIDLLDVPFPARYPKATTPGIAEFTARLGGADAFVVITPEYNRSFPAALKEAIDYAYDEWQAKPVGFVSYGMGSTGLYAVEQLRTVFTGLHSVTMPCRVGFDLLDGSVDECGEPCEAEAPAQNVKSMLDQLTWWGLALRDARAARPYVS
ncbi:NADPH-dependent oxidoreductase [Actinomadura sp. KC216]|uniref:NADPH-dependent FMN reductase n=1 Tax=Actinomadura sp. KC216 TaxID=2530370 RepID=UPI001049B005|nr:NAD(P)H-dependent oxidoreductase [Actinomadura sp. KC216]TDB83476.1 NADPH-dependent oxidoreductase [Actinomadura sp. KC216]